MTQERITAVRVSNKELVPAAPHAPILSSAEAAWDGILVEQHQLPAFQTPEISVPKHLLNG